MTSTIEISLYPLRDDYPSHVIRFLHKLKEIPDVEINSNGMSTIIIGTYASLWKQLGLLMEEELASGYSLFVMKVAPGRREYLSDGSTALTNRE
ncbi:MAG: hypothetical protein SH808_02105 [Saprospiraceae bacterium]|nr:hypothetical protein [Saprospiraceae bacterium]